MERRCFYVGLLGLLLLSAGCADAPSGAVSTPTVLTWVDDLPEVTISPEPILSVGGMAHYFAGISHAALSGDSVLVVFDGRLLEAVSFDLEDGAVSRWGGIGQGPGEFRSLQGAVDDRGQVWVWDPGQLRVSRFSAFGDLLDDFPLWGTAKSTGALVGPGTGCLWFKRSILDTARVENEGYGRAALSAECVSDTGTSPRFIGLGLEHVDRRGPRGPVPVPFGRETLVASSGGDLWATPNDSIAMERFTSEGASTTLAMLPALAEAIPEEAYSRIASSLMGQIRRHLPEGPHATYPDIVEFWGSPDGGGWVGLRGSTFVRLSPDGVPVEQLVGPGHRVLTATDRHVVTIRTDFQSGAPVVEVWGLSSLHEPQAG